MSENFLIDQPDAGVTRITFNRPETLNGFTSQMFGEFLAILEGIARDPSIRVLVLTGAGRGFSSGYDGAGSKPADWVPADIGKPHSIQHFMKELAKLAPAIRSLPQAVIAAVNGPVAGYGYTIALACDMIVAAQSSKFVNAFHNAGNGSEGGFAFMLCKAVGAKRAAEIMFTGRAVMADEAERIGLVSRTVPDDKLMETVLEIAKNIIACTPLDTWTTKQTFLAAQSATDIEQAILLENRALVMINHTADTDEKRAARREKRDPVFHSK